MVDLLDYDVRFGQGFLFCAAAAVAAGGGICYRRGDRRPRNRQSNAPNGTSNPVPHRRPGRRAPVRATGNAALARRAAGPV